MGGVGSSGKGWQAQTILCRCLSWVGFLWGRGLYRHWGWGRSCAETPPTPGMSHMVLWECRVFSG